MADLNSTVIAQFLADPITKVDPPEGGSRARIKIATVPVKIADNNGDVLRFLRFRSTDSLLTIGCYTTAITGATDVDCGLYDIEGGAVVLKDLYTDGFSLAVASPSIPPAAGSGVAIQLRIGDVVTSDPTVIGQMIWEDLGLSEDSHKQYDLCLTANLIGSANGDVTFVVEYIAA